MALETLECRNNRLTTLNVSELAALSNLYCYNNQLTSLVVSGCSAMTILDCRMNQLTELDVTDCTELFYLRCTSNQLTALDVSKNTKLDELDCRKNRLTELNVSYNTKIGFLRCSENMLTELDASNLSEVISIYCQQNQLTVLRVPEGNTNLNFLYCYQNQIKGKAMDALLESMPAKEAGVINDFRVIYSSGEQNILTKVQAQAIKAKNWTPLHHVGGYSWEEYEGSDEPTGIRPTPDPSRNGGETYDLSGRRISSKPQRGIYIEKQGSAKANGRKVVK